VVFLLYRKKIYQHQVFKEEKIDPITLLVVVTVVLLLVYLLVPTPNMDANAEKAGLNDFTFPTNSNSRSVPVLYGTSWVSGNILYYNNLISLEIKACS